MASSPNVLHRFTDAEQSFVPSPYLFGRVAGRGYRAAVAQTIREVMAEKALDEEQLAEKLGCSKGTVKNALKEHGNMDPVTMLNLGAMFGGQERLKHILALINGSPTEPPTKAERFRRLHADLDALEKAE